MDLILSSVSSTVLIINPSNNSTRAVILTRPAPAGRAGKILRLLRDDSGVEGIDVDRNIAVVTLSCSELVELVVTPPEDIAAKVGVFGTGGGVVSHYGGDVVGAGVDVADTDGSELAGLFVVWRVELDVCSNMGAV